MGIRSTIPPGLGRLKGHLTRAAFPALGTLFLAVVVVWPLATLFQYAFRHGLEAFWASISSPEALYSLRISLMVALATTAINGVMGTAIALMLVKHQFPWQGLVDWLVDLPLVIPASATGLSIMLLYGPFGILGKAFEAAGATIIAAVPAILLVHVFTSVPLVVRSVEPRLAQMDPREEEAAKVLGANLRMIAGLERPTEGEI